MYGGCSLSLSQRRSVDSRLLTAEYGSPNVSHKTTISSTVDWVSFTSKFYVRSLIEVIWFSFFQLQEVGLGCRIRSYQQTFLFLTVDREHSTFMPWPILLMERAFFSAHLHFFSHSRRPRNGSCCRGCMTNILIDHSFTCGPRRHIVSWKSLRKLLPSGLCSIFLEM